MDRLLELRWPVCDVLSNPEYTELSDARTLELTNEQWCLMSELTKCLKPLQVGLIVMRPKIEPENVIFLYNFGITVANQHHA